MLEEILLDALATFGVTLVITKSSLFASKREYVSRRWAQAKKNPTSHWLSRAIHYFWFKMHTCAMCLGMWVALYWSLGRQYPFWRGLLAVFGLNWLLHCAESLTFHAATYFEGKNGIITPEESENVPKKAKAG